MQWQFCFALFIFLWYCGLHARHNPYKEKTLKLRVNRADGEMSIQPTTMGPFSHLQPIKLPGRVQQCPQRLVFCDFEIVLMVIYSTQTNAVVCQVGIRKIHKPMARVYGAKKVGRHKTTATAVAAQYSRVENQSLGIRHLVEPRGRDGRV